MESRFDDISLTDFIISFISSELYRRLLFDISIASASAFISSHEQEIPDMSVPVTTRLKVVCFACNFIIIRLVS